MRMFLQATLVACALMLTSNSPASECPSVTKIVVPFPAGGPADFFGQMVAQHLRNRLPGCTVIVEHIPGVNGVNGTREFKMRGVRGDRDFSLLVVPLSTLTLASIVGENTIGYSAKEDFIAMPVVFRDRLTLVVGNHPLMKDIASFNEYIRHIRNHPKDALYGTPGINSTQHFYGITISQAVGVEMSDVSYKGQAPIINDLLGGHIQAAIILSQDAKRYREMGIRSLAVSGTERWEEMQDVPTFLELGIPIHLHSYIAVFLQKRAPGHLVAKYSQILAEIIDSADILSRIEAQGTKVVRLGPTEATSFINEYQESWMSNPQVVVEMKRRFTWRK